MDLCTLLSTVALAQSWFTCSAHQYVQREYSVVTYNCQALPPHRPLEVILRRIDSDIIFLQSTGSRWAWLQRKQQQMCYCKRVLQYYVYTWPFSGCGIASNKTCGVIIAIKGSTFPKTAVKQCWSPPEALAGRIGALRLRLRRGEDFSLVCAYFPPSASPFCESIRLH